MDVTIVAVPYDSGARDVRMGNGPRAILDAGIADCLRNDGHQVTVVTAQVEAQPLLPEIATSFALQRQVARTVADASRAGSFVIVLGGNCNTAVGTVGGLRGTHIDPAVLWFDAHADLNTPDTTASGFLDGMAVSMLLGDCWAHMLAQQSFYAPIAPDRILFFGTRDVDDEERTRLRLLGLPLFSPDDIARRSYSDALHRVHAGSGDAYLHIDLDVLDPSEGRANTFAVDKGVLLVDLLQVVREIRQTFRVGAMALTAYDPSVDHDGLVARCAIAVAREAVRR